MMRILVTGAGGLIGGYLARFLAEDGHRVVAAYRNSKPNLSLTAPGTQLVRLDLSEGVQGLESVDVIIHAAAHTHLIPDSRASDYIQSNITGTLNLARYAKAVKARLVVYMSTLSVYGRVQVDELNEDTPLNAPEMYGLSKYTGELILKEFAEYFPSICLRLPGVVGPGYFTPWLGSVLKKANGGETINIYNAQSKFNNIVDLRELADFISHMIRWALTGFEAVNLGAAEPIKIREVANLIVSLTGSASRVVEHETVNQSFSISTNKLTEVLGFQPSTTEAMIRRYVEDNKPVLAALGGY